MSPPWTMGDGCVVGFRRRGMGAFGMVGRARTASVGEIGGGLGAARGRVRLLPAAGLAVPGAVGPALRAAGFSRWCCRCCRACPRGGPTTTGATGRHRCSPPSMLPPASSSARAIDAIGQGVPCLSEGDRRPRPRGAGHPHRHGQLRHPQDRHGQGLDGPATALACPLHTNLGLLDQSGRTLVRRTDAQAITTRRTYLHETTGSGHPGLHRKNNERPKPFKWTKSADDILASVKRFCHRTDQTLCGEL